MDDEVVLEGELWVRTVSGKKKKEKWKKKLFRLTSSGKLKEENSNNKLSLQQRTRLYPSEFRDFCFTICTPSEMKVVLAADSEEEKQKWLESLEAACRNAPPTDIKIVLVSDERSTSERLLKSFFEECGQLELASQLNEKNTFRADDISLSLDLEVTREKVRLTLCCVSDSDYAKLRVLNYVNANAFMVVFCTDSAQQFENIEKVWVPEIKPTVEEKGASLFLVGVQPSTLSAADQVVDRLVGEELADFLDSTYFDVNLNQKKKKNSTTEDSAVEQDEDRESTETDFDSPAETFLDVLHATLEDSAGSILVESEASTDVANLGDFKTATSKASDFIAYLKSKSMIARDKIMRKTTTNEREKKSSKNLRLKMNESTKKISTLQKIKNVLKNLRPKRKKRLDKRPKLAKEEQQAAHFVSKGQTGSLIFLGPLTGSGSFDVDFLDQQNQED